MSFELKFLPKIAKINEFFLKCLKNNNQYFLINEIVIIEIILNYKIGTEFSSKDIQNSVYSFFLENEFLLDASYFKKSDSSKSKTKLRVQINNIMSSNLDHQNMIGKREEIVVFKSNGFNKFIANSELIDFWKNKNINFFEMHNFNKRFPYLYRYFHFLVGGLPKNVCKNHNSKNSIVYEFSKNLKENNIDYFSPLKIEWLCEICVKKKYYDWNEKNVQH